MRSVSAGLSLLLVLAVSSTAAGDVPVAAEPATAPVSPAEACRRGEALRGVAEYALAAEALTQCARLFPAEARGKTALADAVVLRLGLGEDAEAMRLAGDFVKMYGATDHTRAATVVFAVAAHQGEKARWREASEILSRNQSLIDAAPIDIRLQARLVAGRAQLHGPTPDRGYAELKTALAMYGNGGALGDMIAIAYPNEDEGQRMRRIGKSLNAVGDALVLLADRDLGKSVASQRPPVYTGTRSMDALHHYLTTAVPEWMTRRRMAIEERERQYTAVLEMRPVPPPKAVIAAAGAVGKMWADYADDLAHLVPLDGYPVTRVAATPTTTPTRAEARAALEEVRRPIRERQAIPAMRKCVSLSVKYQYTDERSQGCEAWLVKNDPETRPRSELAPEPQALSGQWAANEPATATSTSTSTSPPISP